jgi:hypothetical protein
MSRPDTDELRIIDGRGCLTLEAMGFPEHLGTEQRVVVERHVRTCSICAQQQTDLVKAKERLRRARPRIPVPSEAKALSRQLLLRSLSERARLRAAANRGLAGSGHPIRTGPRRTHWYLSRLFWFATFAGLGLALVLALIALLLIR